MTDLRPYSWDLPRYAARAPVHSYVAYRHEQEVGIGEILNISHSGLFVSADVIPPVGSPVELKFALPEKESTTTLMLRGEVVRQSDLDSGPVPGGMGIRLLAVTESDRARIQSFVERHLGDEPTEVMTASLIQRSLLEDSADRYELLDLLGNGSTAEVFEAYDKELGERVALKIFKAQLSSDPVAVARMHREIRLARKVKSQHAAAIFEFGRIAHRDFLAMEFVPGVSLHRVLLEEGALPEARVIELALQALDGLAAAHRLGIVHRDLKPSNLMLTPDGRVVVLDFGIARGHDDPKVTSDQVIVGTPAYMSPEQVDDRLVLPVADVYSMGCVLFRLLTGRLPFTGRTPVEIAVRHLRHPPPRVRDVAPDVSPALEAVLLRCLSKDPADRYKDADALADALREVGVGDDPYRSLADAAAVTAGAASTRRRILLGEPNRAVGRRFRLHLEAEGFDVHAVDDGFHLVEHALDPDDRYDAVVVDLRIPSIDGLEISQILRSKPRTAATPIVLVSEETMLRNVAGFIPACSFLAKPLAPADLVAFLRRLEYPAPD